jgi:hypothetical protein
MIHGGAMAELSKAVPDQPISIALHPKHWVIVVAAIDSLHQSALHRIEELKKQGVDHSTLPPTTVSALTGPMMVRGILVKELTAHCVMTPEANAALGIDAIMKEVEKYRQSD